MSGLLSPEELAAIRRAVEASGDRWQGSAAGLLLGHIAALPRWPSPDDEAAVAELAESIRDVPYVQWFYADDRGVMIDSPNADDQDDADWLAAAILRALRKEQP